MSTFRRNIKIGTIDPLWGTEDIADKAITKAKLADDAVTEDKIADGAIWSHHIRPDAVGTDAIEDECITCVKLSNEAVTWNKLADDAVTEDKIANWAVTWDKLADSVQDKINKYAEDEKLDEIKVLYTRTRENMGFNSYPNAEKVKLAIEDAPLIYEQESMGSVDISAASETEAGVMSAADKKTLNDVSNILKSDISLQIRKDALYLYDYKNVIKSTDRIYVGRYRRRSNGKTANRIRIKAHTKVSGWSLYEHSDTFVIKPCLALDKDVVLSKGKAYSIELEDGVTWRDIFIKNKNKNKRFGIRVYRNGTPLTDWMPFSYNQDYFPTRWHTGVPRQALRVE